jgi:hypothetical protein
LSIGLFVFAPVLHVILLLSFEQPMRGILEAGGFAWSGSV